MVATYKEPDFNKTIVANFEKGILSRATLTTAFRTESGQNINLVHNFVKTGSAEYRLNRHETHIEDVARVRGNKDIKKKNLSPKDMSDVEVLEQIRNSGRQAKVLNVHATGTDERGEKLDIHNFERLYELAERSAQLTGGLARKTSAQMAAPPKNTPADHGSPLTDVSHLYRKNGSGTSTGHAR